MITSNQATINVNSVCTSQGISKDFENGNIGTVSRNGNTFTMTFGQGAGGIWFHIRVCNLQDQACTFILKDVRADHWKSNTKIVASYDRENWQQVSGTLQNCHSGTCGQTNTCCDYQWSFTPASREMYFAFFYPYTTLQLDNLLDYYKNNPHLTVQNIGYGPLGSSYPPQKLITITDSSSPDAGKKVVWLVGREDQWESLGTHYMVGEIKYLLSNDPLAVNIRKNIIFKMIPLVSVAGEIKGTILGMNDTNPSNIVYLTEKWCLNNDGTSSTGTCSTTAVTPAEIQNIKNQIISWKNSGKNIDLFGRHHSWAWMNSTTFQGRTLNLRNAASARLGSLAVISGASNSPGRLYKFINYLYGRDILSNPIPDFSYEAGASGTTISSAEYMGEMTVKLIADFFGVV